MYQFDTSKGYRLAGDRQIRPGLPYSKWNVHALRQSWPQPQSARGLIVIRWVGQVRIKVSPESALVASVPSHLARFRIQPKMSLIQFAPVTFWITF